MDVRGAGMAGEITQRRLNASAAADAAGGSGVVWQVEKDEMGGGVLASDG